MTRDSGDSVIITPSTDFVIAERLLVRPAVSNFLEFPDSSECELIQRAPECTPMVDHDRQECGGIRPHIRLVTNRAATCITPFGDAILPGGTVGPLEFILGVSAERNFEDIKGLTDQLSVLTRC